MRSCNFSSDLKIKDAFLGFDLSIERIGKFNESVVASARSEVDVESLLIWLFIVEPFIVLTMIIEYIDWKIEVGRLVIAREKTRKNYIENGKQAKQELVPPE